MSPHNEARELLPPPPVRVYGWLGVLAEVQLTFSHETGDDDPG